MNHSGTKHPKYLIQNTILYIGYMIIIKPNHYTMDSLSGLRLMHLNLTDYYEEEVALTCQ